MGVLTANLSQPYVSGGMAGYMYVDFTGNTSITATTSTFTYTTGVRVNNTATQDGYNLTNFIYTSINFDIGQWSGTSGAVARGVYSPTLATFSKQYTTSNYFNSSNSTTKTVSINVTTSTGSVDFYPSSWGSGATQYASVPYPTVSSATIATLSVTLNAPPTYTLSTLSVDTPYVYTGITTASVTVSNLSAKYGGSITDVTFTIGNTSVSRSDAGTLSILLDTVGTFTPTVVVTDSRGQTTTKTLDPITVNGYVAPAVSFTADRTLSSGVPDDEGGYATVDATFTYTDVVADLVAPSVVVTDENGTQTTPVVTWYTTRASDGTLSGTLSDWSNVARGATVYGLIPNVNTQYSHQISIRPRDTEGTGTTITQTLATAFYTLDFLAGGHGIAFGKPAINTGFECAMDATFEEDLVAQDMTQQEVDDFVDNISGGGSPVVDKVVEQGTDGDWLYRKWESGIAECWITYRKARSGNTTNFYFTFPFSFITFPYALTSGGATSNTAANASYTYASQTVIDCYVYATAGAEVWIYAYIVGKWK